MCFVLGNILTKVIECLPPWWLAVANCGYAVRMSSFDDPKRRDPWMHDDWTIDHTKPADE